MASREGNVLNVPGSTRGESYTPSEVLASTSNLYQKGRTIKGGQGVLEAGTILSRDAATKKYVKCTDTTSAGALVAKGILRLAVDTGTTTPQDKLGAVIFGGVVKRGVLVAVNTEAVTAAAVVSLKGRDDTSNPADLNSYIVHF